MNIFAKKTFDIIIGDSICGINESFNALQSTFYFQFGSKCIPEKDFIGCPNATLVWALKASRLIINGSYVEREITLYGSDLSIVFSVTRKNKLKMDFIKNGKIMYTYSDNYISIVSTILMAAEKSKKLSKGYEFNTMAEHVIENEIRLMKKHIEKINM